jgi:hypothetical protein
MNQQSNTQLGEEHVIPYNLGCLPSPSGAGKLFIQYDDIAYVVFQAVAVEPHHKEYHHIGNAIVECHGVGLTRSGYPNDEGLPEHPLYYKGLKDIDGVGEVINSRWKAELELQMDTSARRIWGDQYFTAYNVSANSKRAWDWKHLVFTFKECTFECIAHKVVVTLTSNTYSEIIHSITQRMISD